MEGEEDAGGLRGGCVELHQGAVSRGRGDGVLAFFGGGVFFILLRTFGTVLFYSDAHLPGRTGAMVEAVLGA